MPIDPRIALGYQPTQVASPINQLSQVMQVRDMQQNQLMNKLKADEYQRSLSDNNALRQALSAPDADPYKALLGQGRVKDATDFAKGQADLKKTQGEVDAKSVETAHKRIDSWGQAMGFVRQNPTPENAMAAVQHLVTMGIMPPEKAQAAVASLAQNPTPQNIAQWADMGFRTALGAKEQLPKLETKNIGGQTITQQIDPLSGRTATVNTLQNTQTPDNAASNARMAADNAASRAVTIRGQDKLDERARETNAQGKTQIVETPEGFVIVDKNSGASRPAVGGDGKPLKGKANDRVMTDAQAKANLFGTRMKESDRILTELEGKYSPMAVNAKVAAGETPVVGGVAGAVGNAMLSSEGQMAEQAQRDFINAVLRRESGAVISPTEFENAKKQYFPQPNDGKKLLDQKRRNRALATSGMEAEVPGGFRTSPSLTNPGAPGGVPSDIAAILKKHGGK
jgi:hypothetical protein